MFFEVTIFLKSYDFWLYFPFFFFLLENFKESQKI